MNSWNIVVKSKPLEEVQKNAIREYNDYQASLERDDGYFALFYDCPNKQARKDKIMNCYLGFLCLRQDIRKEY